MPFLSTARSTAAIIIATSILGASSVGAQTTINFDDLPSTAGWPGLGASYAGLNWTTFGYTAQGVTQGLQDIVCRSALNCANNGSAGASSVISSTPITFSAWVRRWAPVTTGSPAASVLIEGLDALGVVAASQRLTLTSTYQSFTMSTPFTTLRFTPNANAAGTGTATGYFLIDDVVLNPRSQSVEPGSPNVVPEPSTYALMAAGLLGLVGVTRARARRA